MPQQSQRSYAFNRSKHHFMKTKSEQGASPSRASSGPVVRDGKGPDASLPFAAPRRAASWRIPGKVKIGSSRGQAIRSSAKVESAQLAPEILQVIAVVAEILLAQ